MSSLQQNVSLADSPWRRATGGSRRSTITTTVSASTARCVKRTLKDRASSPREVGLSVKHTPVKSPIKIIYNSDTVYSTTTFRPVSPLPITPPAVGTPSPQRTRKLETPLHFDGGLFSDIRSTDGKLLSKVTVDRVQRSTHHDVIDSPSTVEVHDKNYVDDIIKSETIINQDIITVKFTPVPPEFDSQMISPQLAKRSKTPIQYLKDDFVDLQSYKIVNSLCKEKLLEANALRTQSAQDLITLEPTEVESSTLAKFVRSVSQQKQISCSDSDPMGQEINSIPIKMESDSLTSLVEKSIKTATVSENRELDHFLNTDLSKIERSLSPLPNFLITEHLTKINSYLQESLDVCSGNDSNNRCTPSIIHDNVETKHEYFSEAFDCVNVQQNIPANSVLDSSQTEENSVDSQNNRSLTARENSEYTDPKKSKSTLNSVRRGRPSILNAISNMPIHYLATILCIFLIVYNLIYQYIKLNCPGNKI